MKEEQAQISARIDKIMLENFCGITSLRVNCGGENTVIRGDNATGKSTIANAFMWVFTGKDSSGNADFNP